MALLYKNTVMSLAAFDLHVASLPGGQNRMLQVWRAESLAHAEGATQASGFAALDAELPGGGWPVGAMTEILHAGPESYAWPLLLPALARAVQVRGRPVALIGAPHTPFSPALAAQGLPPEALLWVRSDAAPARLWACEQALRCADVAAVLAWLPQARVGELRRLQLAAAQFESLLWVFRPAAHSAQASPARLRLLIEPDPQAAGSLAVHLIKRRGPPLASPVSVFAQPPRLAAVLAASRQRRARRLAPAAPQIAAAGATVVRLGPHSVAAAAGLAAHLLEPSETPHALDRAFVAA